MKIVPRKRFGQNFLTDLSVINEIIRIISPSEDDLMIEIGPGTGAMTKYLLEKLPHLSVIEIDRNLVSYLKKTFSGKLSVYEGDVLSFDFSKLKREGKKLRIVGNLPYNISTPLLFHLAKFANKVEDQHFMLQKEVVERMVAQPKSKNYGRLSVMLQWRYLMEMVLSVPPDAFNPKPKVDSAIVRMIPIKKPLFCVHEDLEKVVTAAFTQRRKIIRNNLSKIFTENDLIDSGINPQARAEELSLEQFVDLANKLRMT